MSARELPAWAASPEALEREDRIRLIAECARALLKGELPAPEARMFTAGGLIAWLEQSGDLCRDHWRVIKPKSHHTPSFVYRQLHAHQDERLSESERLECEESQLDGDSQ